MHACAACVGMVSGGAAVVFFAVYHILSHVFRFGRARNASLLSMRFQALSVFLFFFVGGAVSSSKSGLAAASAARLVKRFWYTLEVLTFCCVLTVCGASRALRSVRNVIFYRSAEQRVVSF